MQSALDAGRAATKPNSSRIADYGASIDCRSMAALDHVFAPDWTGGFTISVPTAR